MRKNADQNNSEYKHFLRSVMHADLHKKISIKKIYTGLLSCQNMKSVHALFE